ncbi:MAG: cysteine desulfurase [Clostridia bacterium]|nr:cysteine desulfurase [Clostridia bacterium]
MVCYLDNAGTTKMFEQCVEVHHSFSCDNFYNPSALSEQAMGVSKLISKAEKYVLQRLGASEGNVLFTGCATESNNIAVKGSLRSGNWEYVFSAGEHPSVFNISKKLELDGFKVHIVPLDEAGRVDVARLEAVLNERTRFISVMHVSNETGAVNDLVKISNLKNKKCPKAVLHVDGVQGFMKIPFSLRSIAVDLYSFSAHKFHGPKGVGGLYVRNKGALKELFQGGGQQYTLRSGTENVSGIMQMCKALELIDEKENFERVVEIKKIFNSFLGADGLIVKDFGGSPYIENLIFSGVKGETMLHALNQKGVIVGLGSACSSKKAGNRILEKIGLAKDEIISSVRISFNAYMTDEEVEWAAKTINKVYLEIKEKVS